MMRVAIIGVVAACASPAPSSLTPHVEVITSLDSLYQVADRLYVSAYFDGDPDVAVEATFRGTRMPTSYHSRGLYRVTLDLDRPLEADEPVTVDVDGISMTTTAPPGFDGAQVPLFVSRTHDTTISWTSASDDPITWSVLSSTVPCVSQSVGGEIAPGATSVTFTQADWGNSGSCPGATGTTDVQFFRHRDSDADPAFAGGTLQFIRTFDALFASTP
jgi:hypothetical protein